MTKQRLIGLGVVAAVAATASQVGFGDSGKARIGTGNVSALAQAARPGDRLPAEVLAYPFAEHNFASPTGAGSRLLRSEGSLSIYAVPGKAGMLCLVELDEVEQTSGGACTDRSVLLTGSIFMSEQAEDGSQQVVGLVGDGHTYAEAAGKRVGVERNVFLLRGVRADKVTIGSPTAAQTVDIGS
jgi:hypothetical protein